MNWTRIIPQDNSPEYFWNTTTNVRQWEYPAELGAAAAPLPIQQAYAPMTQEDAALGQGAAFGSQQQQQPQMQRQPPQQRAMGRGRGVGGGATLVVAANPAAAGRGRGRGGGAVDSRAAQWAAEQSAGGAIDEMSIFVRNLDPKASIDDIRLFFGRFGKVADVAHQ